MRISAKCDWIAVVIAALAPLGLTRALGQTSISFGDPKAPNVLTPGAPFQGERVTKTTMRLQDGSLLVREEHELLGRDTDGRFFDESYRSAASGGTSHQFVFADPIAKREVSWTDGSTTASVNPLQQSTRLNVAALPLDRRIETAYFPRDKATETTEDLGSRMIDGVVCTGMRTVTTLAAGAIGNSTPLQRSEEVWIANDLQIVVAETDKSPTLGTRTVAVVSLQLSAPSADRFDLPKELTIQETPGLLSGLPGLPGSVVLPKVGFGSGTGNVNGSGNGGDANSELYRLGDSVSAPVATLTPAAECSDEARRAKYKSVVLISLTVNAQGNPQNPQVVRSLGMGLDEKALEAVQKYRFKPAMKDGTAVPVRITIEIEFHCSID